MGKCVWRIRNSKLTALYFEQEFRKNQTIPMSDELKETYEEMLVHFSRGKYIVPTQEEHGIPILKQKEGQGLPSFIHRSSRISKVQS